MIQIGMTMIKRWANAKSADGSYWVWIPRYAYKIESCYHMSGEDCEALTESKQEKLM